MQGAKKAVEAVKETAANVGASAVAGKDKASAVVQEKVDKMMGHDELEKELATRRKEEKIHEAEYQKQVVRQQNAAQKEANVEAAEADSTARTGHSTSAVF